LRREKLDIGYLNFWRWRQNKEKGQYQKRYHQRDVKQIRGAIGFCYLYDRIFVDGASHPALCLVMGVSDGIGEEGEEKKEEHQHRRAMDR